MSWIDRRIAEQKEIAARNKLISDHAEPTFEALWEKLKEYIAEAKTKSFPIFTNGSPLKRKVSISVPLADQESVRSPDEFTLSLEKASGCIVASGARKVNFKFCLDLCPDNVVCLKWNGEVVSIEDAAIAMLDQFLFPDLPRASKPANKDQWKTTNYRKQRDDDDPDD